MISRRALFGLLAAAPFVKRRPKLGEPGNPVMGALPPAGATFVKPGPVYLGVVKDILEMTMRNGGISPIAVIVGPKRWDALANETHQHADLKLLGIPVFPDAFCPEDYCGGTFSIPALKIAERWSRSPSRAISTKPCGGTFRGIR